METNLELGRIAGIRVGLHWSVLVIWWLLTWSLATAVLPDAIAGQSSLAYWTTASVGAVVLLGCLLAHELSHAITARHHGVSTEAITLWALGGVAQLSEESPTPRSELAIAAAGPATSITLAAGAYALSIVADAADVSQLVVAATSWLALVNLVLALFNLLPGIPLDGGRILHALLWWRTGDRDDATSSAARVGRAFGYVLIGLGVFEITTGYWGGLWLVLVGWFLLSAATAERDLGGLRHALSGVTVGEVMTRDPDLAPDWISVEDLLEHHLLRQRHSSFPVRDRQGRVTGLITLADVKRLDPARRKNTTVIDVATPLSEVTKAEVSTPMVELMTQLATTSAGQSRRALVVRRDPLHGEHIVGIVTPTDISRAVELGALAHA